MATTREDVIVEMAEVQQDLAAFSDCYSRVMQRIRELDDSPARRDRLLNWAGTQAVMNVLTLCIVRCEGLIEDYKKTLAGMPAPPSN